MPNVKTNHHQCINSNNTFFYRIRSSINPNTFATLTYQSAAHIVVDKQNFTEYNKKMGVIW
jgi:hypothetical protein